MSNFISRPLRRSARIIVGCLIFVAVPAATQAPMPAPYVKPPPPGELVEIGTRRLHVECKGKAGGPIVIFEAGLSQFTAHSTYGAAQDLIAPFARVCIYDRAGLGWSDPVDAARTQQDMVEDLRRMIAAKGLKGPLILVGHSLGGLLSRLYARQYPADVVAMVLVDASPETVTFGPGAAESRKAAVAKIDTALIGAKDGVPVAALPETTPVDVKMAFTPEILRTVKQEYEAIDLLPDEFRKPDGFGTLGERPLVIIRRGKTASPPSDVDVTWRKAQEAMTSLSTRSSLVVAEKAGHVIPYDDPAVVAAAVQQVLHQIRKPRP